MKPTDQNNNSGKDDQDSRTVKADNPSASEADAPQADSRLDAKSAISAKASPNAQAEPPKSTDSTSSAAAAAAANGRGADKPGLDKPGLDKPGSDKPGKPAAPAKDAAQPKTTAAPASSRTTPPGGTPPQPPAKAAGAGRGLAGLALLVALIALGLSGWQWYQADQRQRTDASLGDQLAQLQSAQQQQAQALETRLQGLPDANEWLQVERLSADMQRSQQAISQRLETLQGDAQADWKLAEAEYMLRLASLRLLASQDVIAAQELLSAVDGILRAQPDSGVFAVREQLAQFQAELSALPEIDRSGIYLRLAAMREQVTGLVALPVPAFDPDELSVEEEYQDRLARRTRAERVLMRLERYVRVDFQRGKVITPLLDEAELQRVQRTLQLTMEQAQWAALRGEAKVFQASLEQADGMLRQYLEMENPQVEAMLGQLERLAEQDVSLSPPDLSPLQQGLAAYIQSRRTPATGNAEAAE